MKLCLAVPLPRLPVVSHPSASGAPASPSPDSFVPLDGEGQRRPGPPLEVACLQTTTNFLDLTNSPTGHRPCASSTTTARPATPTTSPSKKGSRPKQPHRPSWRDKHLRGVLSGVLDVGLNGLAVLAEVVARICLPGSS